MEKSREGWEFTVLLSNTRRAHELDAIRDWVVIHWEGRSEGQCTVVTARRRTPGTLRLAPRGPR
jgi:putative hydrolase